MNKSIASQTAKHEPQPNWPLPAVYLLHGKGGSPAGTVALLQQTLERRWPGLEFVRLRLPHSDPTVPAEASVEYLLNADIPQGALLVGISLGGLVAAKLQERGRSDLQVIAISSPTWADEVELETRVTQRLAFYSSHDEVISGRVAEWPQLASFARDLPWLDHDTDRHIKYLARIFDAFLEGSLARWIDRIHTAEMWRQETGDKVWDLMAKAKRVRTEWRESAWDGGRPQTFAEMGDAMRAGVDWEIAWGDWRHEFIGRKDSWCLAAEPAEWFQQGRRAFLAGVAELFARLYELPKPAWVDQPEYFLPEPPRYLREKSEFEYPADRTPSSAEYYRAQARTAKEMLRRNVICPMRNLTVL